jgi:hypothetical protein
MDTNNTDEVKTYPVDPDALRRFEICQACKYYIAEKTQCNLCGCNIKATINEERGSCPIGKW